MSDKSKGHLVILTTNVLFGFNIPISKVILTSGISPLGWTLMRMAVAAACFWLASLFVAREPVTKKADWVVLVWCAVFGMVFNQLGFILGLARTSPIDASIIATSLPVIVMLIAAAVLREPITMTKVAGVVTGAVGAIILILSGRNAGNGGSDITGDLLCLLSSCSYAIYLVTSKPLVQRYSSVFVMKWMFLFATIALLPFGFTGLRDCNYAAFDTNTWLCIAYSLAFGTFVPYLLIPIALKRLRPTTISMYNYLQPMVASAVAVIAMHDSMTWQKIVAAVLVFAGVYVVNKSKSRAQMEAEKGTAKRTRSLPSA